MDFEKVYKYKPPNVIIDLSFLTTIYAQISFWEGETDVMFGPTNDPLISDDLFVINTIDDYIYEHTAHMLSDMTYDLEKLLSCKRSKPLDDNTSQQLKRRLQNKKHDNTCS